MAGPVEIEWSLDALADLDRFAAFLHGQFPELAARVASELVARTDVLRRQQTSIDFVDFGTNRRTALGRLGKRWFYGMALSPGQDALLVSFVDSAGANLMVVDNFRYRRPPPARLREIYRDSSRLEETDRREPEFENYGGGTCASASCACPSHSPAHASSNLSAAR